MMRSVLILALLPAAALAFSCSQTTQLASVPLNLTLLDRDVQISMDVDTSPSKTTKAFLLNPCRPLQTLGKTGEKEDQCPQNSWICLQRNITRGSTSIVAEVQSLYESDGNGGPQDVQYYANARNESGVIFTFAGRRRGAGDIQIVLNVTCSQTPSEPQLVKDSVDALVFGWSSPATCSVSSAQTPPAETPGTDPEKSQPAPVKDDPESGSTSSLWGTLFTLLSILTCVYLVLGTLYYRFVLGLRGKHQIPHIETLEVILSTIVDGIASLWARCTNRNSSYVQI